MLLEQIFFNSFETHAHDNFNVEKNHTMGHLYFDYVPFIKWTNLN